MSYQGYGPSQSPLTAAQLAAGDTRFLRLDGANGGPGWLKNGFINPSFDNWQRGTTGLSGYGPDRWLVFNGGDGTALLSQILLSPGDASTPSRYACRLSQANRTTATTILGQKIEDVRTFAGKRVRLSGLVRASMATTITPYMEQQFGTTGGQSATTYYAGAPIQVGTTFQSFSTVIDVPSNVSKVISSNSCLLIGLVFSQTGTYTIDFADLEVKEVIPGYGDQAPPFERVPREIDLLRCMRYYETGNYGILGSANAVNAVVASLINFKVLKRVNPTVVVTQTYTSGYDNGPVFQLLGADLGRVYAVSKQAATVENAGTWTANSEL